MQRGYLLRSLRACVRFCPHAPVYVHTCTGTPCTHLPVYIPSHTHLCMYTAVHTHVVTHLYTPVYVLSRTHPCGYLPVHTCICAHPYTGTLLHRPMKTSLRTRVWKSLASSPSPLPRVGPFIRSAGAGPAAPECLQGGLESATF